MTQIHQHTVLQHFQCPFFLQSERPTFAPIQNSRQAITLFVLGLFSATSFGDMTNIGRNDEGNEEPHWNLTRLALTYYKSHVEKRYWTGECVYMYVLLIQATGNIMLFKESDSCTWSFKASLVAPSYIAMQVRQYSPMTGRDVDDSWSAAEERLSAHVQVESVLVRYQRQDLMLS